uniref:Uncharacterized protein n=1 Tax=Noccaea caerulescens TaxID=107243 RepID=A0A1J3CFG7_NOCCA
MVGIGCICEGLYLMVRCKLVCVCQGVHETGFKSGSRGNATAMSWGMWCLVEDLINTLVFDQLLRLEKDEQ